jgi:hypothetical protein
MTDSKVRAPDERAVLSLLASPRFQQGVDDGQWRLISLEWPIALIAVSAAPRSSCPEEFVLRFDLSGYPASAPTAGLWDVSANTYLPASSRPKGERASMIFRADWETGRALYAPWDRVALVSHPDWAQRHSKHAWTNQRDLTFYLANVYEVLNGDDYLGI